MSAYAFWVLVAAHAPRLFPYAGLLNPVRGYRDELIRKGIEPVDYALLNSRALKEREHYNQQQRERKAVPTKQPFKLKQ